MDDSILRRLRGKPNIRKLAVFDIEAKRWVNAYAVGFYDGKEYFDFVDRSKEWNCVDEAIAHILQPKYAGHWIYAHNGGNYDFGFFLYRFVNQPRLQKRYEVTVTPVGSTVVMFEVNDRSSQHQVTCVDNKCKGCRKRGPGERAYKWTFIDSVRSMPLTLDEIAKAFNLGSKVELEMSYDQLAEESNDQLMRRYLRNDCVLLYNAINKLQGTVNGLGGQMGITLPATSMDLFRRKYQREDIHTNRHFLACPEKNQDRRRNEKPSCDNCLHRFIRKAYFGGRTEIYRMKFVARSYVDELKEKIKWTRGPERGELVTQLSIIMAEHAAGRLEISEHDAQCYDINSHYPHSMLEPMPVGPAVELHGLTEEEVFINASKMVGIVECDVYVPEDCYLPPLPVTTKTDKKGRVRVTEDGDGKLTFPTGKFSGTWDAVELQLLQRVGGKILKTYRSIWFEAKPIFASFIKKMYRFRDKRDSMFNAAMAWIAKLLMNSNYGKWAMKEDRSRVVVGPEPGTQVGMKVISLEADVWDAPTYVSPLYIVPQLSVHVTSVARARLWEKLYDVLMKGGRLYYCDTDSVICSGVHLQTGVDLGALKHEATIKRAEFVLPKLYLIETREKNEDKKLEQHLKIRSKGMGPGIRLDEKGDDPYDGQLSHAEWMDLTRRGVPIERHRLTKLREGLARYAKDKTSFPRVVASPKQIKSSYDKRTVLQDYDTKPLQLAA